MVAFLAYIFFILSIIAFLCFLQNNLWLKLSKAELFVNEFDGLFFVDSKNFRNRKNLLNLAKGIRSFTKDKFLRNLIIKLELKLSLFLQDNFIYERLNFTSDNKNDVQLEIDHINKIIKKVNLYKI